ncbi:MAG: YidC/Oxa1 family membrane protein insertase [Patescibacteria group bacterium]
MIAFLKTIIYVPLYNGLMLLLDVLPIADIGIAVIILTFLVKIILYPLAKKTSVTQLQMKERQPELDQIKEKHKNDKQAQALQIMEFYKKYKINPFTSFFTILIQIPVIFSLYYIFMSSGLPVVNNELLYSFITPPESISMNFLGFLDVSGKSLFFALLAGITSFFQMKITTPAVSQKTGGGMGDDLSRMMSLQMKYFMPVLIFFISWRISAVVALYWAASNLLGLAQDLYIKRKLAKSSSLQLPQPKNT